MKGALRPIESAAAVYPLADIRPSEHRPLKTIDNLNPLVWTCFSTVHVSWGTYQKQKRLCIPEPFLYLWSLVPELMSGKWM